MKRAMSFILAGALTLGLAVGAMAWGGGGMMGGAYGNGWGGHMMQPGYHMGYGAGQVGPNGAGPAYGPANCPGWQAFNGNENPAYGPGYHRGQGYGRGPALPGNPSENLER